MKLMNQFRMTPHLTMAFTYLVLLAIFSSGCAALPVAPIIDGEVYNVFEGTARWLSTSGDVMIKVFYNPTTQIIVHARPIADGWAFACERGDCDDIVGYLVNIQTWNAVKEWMISNGYNLVAARTPPNLPMPTIIVIPAAMIQNDNSSTLWACAMGLGVENDSGDCVGRNPAVFTSDESDGFTEESDAWEQVIP